jgi:hypothetical protein
MHLRLLLPTLIISLSTSLMSQTPALAWAKAMGGSGGDGGNSIAVDNSGNVYTTGYFVNTADFDPSGTTQSFTSAGLKDIFISKLDQNGNIVWAKQIGGTGDDEGAALTLDATGNVYVTGSFSGSVDLDPNAGTTTFTSAGSTDVYVIKLDQGGNLQWAQAVGGTGADLSASIAVASDGSVCTTGQFSGTADFDPGAAVSNLVSAGGGDIFISKLDASGNFSWAKQMGGSSTDMPVSIVLSATNEVYTTGYFGGTADFDPGAVTASLTSAGSDDIFISKLDASGNYLWGKSVGGTAADRSYQVATNNSGNIFLTGFFNSTADLDPGAATVNFISAGTGDVFILNLDAGGNYVWAKQMGGTTDNVGHAIAVDNTGNIYLAGVFQGSCDFDPGAGVVSFTASGTNDIFTAMLDPSGNLLWAAQAGGAGADLAEAIAVDASGAVHASGVFLGTADFAPGTATSTLTSAGGGDVFVMKLAGTPTGIAMHENSSGYLRVYPNPSSGSFTIESNSVEIIQIFNSTGELILAKEIAEGKSANFRTQIDLKNFEAGIYLVKAGKRTVRIILSE